MGKIMPHNLKHLRTPILRAKGGKTRNWITQPRMPYAVKKLPIRPEARPNPPLNLKGREVLVTLCGCWG